MYTGKFIIWLGIFLGFTESRESTVCYVNGKPVNEHYLNCSESMIVSVLNAAYGYRVKNNDLNSTCQLKDSDRLVYFGPNLLISIKKQCLNRVNCSHFEIPYFESKTESPTHSTIEYSCERPTGNHITPKVLNGLLLTNMVIVLTMVLISILRRSRRKYRSAAIAA